MVDQSIPSQQVNRDQGTPDDYPRELTMYGSIPRTGRVNVLWSVAVALFLCALEWAEPAAFHRHGLMVNLVHTLCLGYWCWMIIGIVWLGEARRRWTRLSDARARFDRSGVYGLLGWQAVVFVAVLGVPVACALGVLTARTALDLPWPFEVPAERMPMSMALVLSYSLAMATFTVDYLRVHLAANQVRAEAAQRQAVEAQLQLLQTQLEPHMLFNTLANLHALIDADPARAQEMLERLIAFLRATLSASRRTTHPLTEEFARASDYLALMQVRMGARLKVALHLPHELSDLSVPPLLLQPLLENAIQHGLEPSRAGGTLTVTALQQDGDLVLTVHDTGRGLHAAQLPRRGPSGFGLSCVRDRLQSLYGGRASLSLGTPADGTGTLATLHLPMPGSHAVPPDTNA
jgi:signal transduction histidine kinase